MSWYVWRPERKVYLFAPVTASVAAGPEMNRTLLSLASGATCSATPEAVEPAMILAPAPIAEVAAVTALAGSPASSASVTSIGAAVHGVRPLGGVVEADLEGRLVLRSVRGEGAGLAVDEAHLVGRATGRATALAGRRSAGAARARSATGRQGHGRGHRHEPARQTRAPPLRHRRPPAPVGAARVPRVPRERPLPAGPEGMRVADAGSWRRGTHCRAPDVGSRQALHDRDMSVR